jgi:hypothetical protein
VVKFVRIQIGVVAGLELSAYKSNFEVSDQEKVSSTLSIPTQPTLADGFNFTSILLVCSVPSIKPPLSNSPVISVTYIGSYRNDGEAWFPTFGAMISVSSTVRFISKEKFALGSETGSGATYPLLVGV